MPIWGNPVLTGALFNEPNDSIRWGLLLLLLAMGMNRPMTRYNCERSSTFSAHKSRQVLLVRPSSGANSNSTLLAVLNSSSSQVRLKVPEFPVEGVVVNLSNFGRLTRNMPRRVKRRNRTFATVNKMNGVQFVLATEWRSEIRI